MNYNLYCPPATESAATAGHALPMAVILALQGGIWLVIGLGLGLWLAS